MAAPPRWQAPPRRPVLVGRPAYGPSSGDEHPNPSLPARSEAGVPLTPDQLLAETLTEILLWFRPAIGKPTRSISVPPYPAPAVLAVAANPNRIGLIISVPTLATNPVYWSDNAAVSPNDSDTSVAGVGIFPGESMVFGPEDRMCPTYLTTTVGGPAITVRIGEQIAAPAGG